MVGFGMPDERELQSKLAATQDTTDLLIIQQQADRTTMLLLNIAPLLNVTLESPPELLLPPSEPVRRA
jgi:hypothetical protein